MKKTILILAVASLSLVACKKKYRCECDNGAFGQFDERVKKDEAENFCNSFELSERIITGTNVNCSLK